VGQHRTPPQAGGRAARATLGRAALFAHALSHLPAAGRARGSSRCRFQERLERGDPLGAAIRGEFGRPTPKSYLERYEVTSQVEGADGSGTSSTAIRAKIRKLVKDEDPQEPLSDGRIAELLSAAGIPVARRTVAKYREAMGIAASNERRRAGTRQM